MIVTETKYHIGQQVFIVTDEKQSVYFVTGILIRLTGITYELSSSTATRWFYDFEISTEKDVLKSVWA